MLLFEQSFYQFLMKFIVQSTRRDEEEKYRKTVTSRISQTV